MRSATIDFLRSKGLTIPEVYAYSYTPENEAGTEYMLIEYVEGTDLRELWFNLEKKETDSLMDLLAKLQSTMMSISFPAGGSIYYGLGARAFHSTCRSGSSRSRRRIRAYHSMGRPSPFRSPRRSVSA